MSFTAIITANIKDFENNLNRAAKKTDDFQGEIDNKLSGAENSFKDFGLKVGGIIAGVFAVEKITAFAFEIAKLGGEAEGVRAAFNRLGDSSTLERLKEATAGTVSELNLMKRAVSANNLGVPIENLASLFEFATQRAQETGESVDYLVNSIVTGIGRKSVLILDNLGITANQLSEKLNGVGMETASVADIAKAVGDIAAESMERSGGIIDTNAVKMQNLAAEWENFKLGLAENKVIIESVADSLTKTQQMISVWTSSYATTLEKWAIAFELFDKRAERIYNQVKAREDAQKQAADIIDEYTKMYEDAQKPIEDTTAAEVQRIKTIGDLKSEIDTLKASIDNYGISQSAEIQKTLQQIAANEELIKSLTTLKTATNNITRVAAPDSMDSKPTGTLFSPESFKIEPVLEVDKLMAGLKTIKDETKAIMIDLGSVVTSAIDEFAYAIGQGLGGDWSNLGLSLLKAVGNIAQQFGAFMISMGVAALQLETLIANPLTAIAAGAALVALGAMVGGAAQSMIDSNISGSAGGGYSTSTYSSPVYSERQGAYAVEFKIKGGDLAAVLEMDNNQKKRIQ